MVYLNSPALDAAEYTTRPTVKVVITNDKNQLLLINSLLIGGGIEQFEKSIEALHREALEEAGVTCNSTQQLGTILHYRDHTKLLYQVHGYHAKLVKQATPTTTQEDELNATLEWVSFEKAIDRLNANITQYQNSALSTELFQSKYYNTRTALELIVLARPLVESMK